jgi:hypothetical protein
MNNQLADIMKKETELMVGDTHIKMAEGKTSMINGDLANCLLCVHLNNKH